MRDMMRQNTVEEPKIMELVGLRTIQVQSVYYTNMIRYKYVDLTVLWQFWHSKNSKLEYIMFGWCEDF